LARPEALVDTKTCPSCNADVPVEAARCKHCFHDFAEVQPKKSNPMVALLAFILLLCVVGGGTFYFIGQRSASERTVVDPETQSIVFTKKFADHMETDRVPFSDIAKIEHIFGGPHANFEVVAIGTDGTRYTIKESNDTTLAGYAEQMASIMKKPMEDIRKVQGFDPGTSSKMVEPTPDATTRTNP
jgi:ribosomal protein L40E